MADSDDFGAIAGAILGVIVVVTLVILAVITILTLGSVYGAGAALYNYGLAFRDHVRPAQVTP